MTTYTDRRVSPMRPTPGGYGETVHPIDKEETVGLYVAGWDLTLAVQLREWRDDIGDKTSGVALQLFDSDGNYLMTLALFGYQGSHAAMLAQAHDAARHYIAHVLPTWAWTKDYRNASKATHNQNPEANWGDVL